MMMETDKPKAFFPASILFFACLLAACESGGPITSTNVSTPTPIAATETPPPPPPVQSVPTPVCVDKLSFLYDITIPDGTTFSTGSVIDKQWLVQNSGSCNWDDHYRLRLISGDALGATTEQALYPARTGTQATIRILFTAPQEAGGYTSEWQAFDPTGAPFGDSFFIKIVVSP